MLSTFLSFYIYSFCGCILEMIYCTILNLSYESRKCMLLGLLCPVYGIGAVTTLKATKSFKDSILAVFMVGAITCTLSEYIMHYFYDTFFDVRFWNYSDKFLNINGRVCLLYSLIWGFLSVIIIKFINPYISKVCFNTNKKLTATLLAFFAVDAAVSLYLLRTYNTKHAINIFMLLRSL